MSKDSASDKREKRSRNFSSDGEDSRKPLKMASRSETTLLDLKKLLENVQKEQNSFKVILNKNISDLKKRVGGYYIH